MSDRDDSVVSFDRPRGAPPERLREFLETARRIKEERAAAEVVNELLRATPVEEWPTLATRPELQNNGALERLGNESRERLDRKPLEALALAELATTIADALPDGSYPPVVMAQIRAGAWKDRANALRVLARYDEAFDGVARAEKTLIGYAALSLDRAVVDLVQAMILCDIKELDRADVLIQQSLRVFRSFSDDQHFLHAGQIAAYRAYQQERYEDARDLYADLLESARKTNDRETEARLHNNLGYCETRIGHFAAANIHFSEAVTRFTDLGAAAEALRTKRGAGLVLIAKGQGRLGVDYLEQCQKEFRNLGMFEDAALSGLGIVEALLGRGDAQAATRIAGEVLAEFKRVSNNSVAADLVHQLQLAIDEGAASIESVRSIYERVELACQETQRRAQSGRAD